MKTLPIFLRAFPAAFLLLSCIPAAAVQRASDGTGDVVLFPVLTGDAGFQTLISLSLADMGAGAAVRIALRDGRTGERVLGMNLLLSPGDHFAAAISVDRVVWSDDSCVSIAGGTISNDGGLETVMLDEPFTGFAEAIEMTSIDPQGAVGAGLAAPDRDCGALEALLSDLRDEDRLTAARGALGGQSILLDVDAGLSFPVEPTVLEDFRDQPLFLPASDQRPTLSDASPAQSTIFGEFDSADGPVRSLTSNWPSPIDAVSAVLAHRALETDFSVEAGLGAATDVILSFPTRHHYVGTAGDIEQPPFVTAYLIAPLAETGQQFTLLARDRSGATPRPPSFKCSPAPPLLHPGPLLSSSQISLRVGLAPVVDIAQPYEVVQLSEFANTSACQGFNTGPVRELMESGILAADLSLFEMHSEEGHVYKGLPLIGASLTAVVNETLDGGSVRANYGLTNPLRLVRDLVFPIAKSAPIPALLGTESRPLQGQSAAISADGEMVLFATHDPLDTGDEDEGSDIYLLTAGAPPVKLSSTLTDLRETHHAPVISGNGSSVAWNTCVWKPIGNNTEQCEAEIRLFSMESAETVSMRTLSGFDADSFLPPAFSANGSKLAWMTEAGQLAVLDRSSGTTTTHGIPARQLLGLSPDGGSVYYVQVRDSDNMVVRHVLASGAETALLPDGLLKRLEFVRFSLSNNVRYAVLSADGQAYRLDVQTLELVPINVDSSGVAIPGAREIDISGDGETALFSSNGRLRSGLPLNIFEIYQWSAVSGDTKLISVGADGYAGNGHSRQPVISADGSVAAFITSAANIAPDGSAAEVLKLVRIDLLP